MTKKVMLTWLMAGFLGFSQAQNTSTLPSNIKSVLAISRILGDGRKVESVILEYDTPISNKSLSNQSFGLICKKQDEIAVSFC